MKRFLPENIIIAGLYYDEQKPNPFDLLFPLLSDFRRLFEEHMQLIYNGVKYDFLPMLLHVCCDLPARAEIQNFKYPTGKNACPICYHHGARIIVNKRAAIRYTKEKKSSNLRTHSQTVTYSQADRKTHSVKGLVALWFYQNLTLS